MSPHSFLVGAIVLGLFAAPAAAYQEITVSNGGAISGRITYSGAVPTKQIVPDDKEICGGPRKDAQIGIGSDGGVQDAVVYLTGIKEGKAWQDKASPLLDNVDCRFEPQMLAMNPGPLLIRNSDDALHNTHVFYGRRTAVNVALPRKGQEIKRELKRPGILRIECDEHGHMHGAGYVAANPYYAATAKDGAFKVTDVPPGKYTLVVYQRHTGPRKLEVQVKPGATADVSVDLAKK